MCCSLIRAEKLSIIMTAGYRANYGLVGVVAVCIRGTSAVETVGHS